MFNSSLSLYGIQSSIALTSLILFYPPSPHASAKNGPKYRCRQRRQHLLFKNVLVAITFCCGRIRCPRLCVQNLFGYLDGSIPIPSKALLENNLEVTNVSWFQQDQLIQNAILATVCDHCQYIRFRIKC